MTSTATATLTQYHRREEDEAVSHPLDLRLIARLYQYTLPYSTSRNWLILLVVLRSIQLPLLTWVIAALIKGPIEHGNMSGIAGGVVGFLVLAGRDAILSPFPATAGRCNWARRSCTICGAICLRICSGCR